MDNEFGKDLEGSGRVLMAVLCQNLLAGTQEKIFLQKYQNSLFPDGDSNLAPRNISLVLPLREPVQYSPSWPGNHPSDIFNPLNHSGNHSYHLL
jgi:hypothetical protein